MHLPAISFVLALLLALPVTAAADEPLIATPSRVDASVAAPDFSVEDPAEILSVEALHGLLESALLPDPPADPAVAEIAKRLAACRATGAPEIVVERAGTGFTLSDGLRTLDLSDPRHAAPLAALFSRLGRHLGLPAASGAPLDGRIVLSGDAIARAELRLPDGTRLAGTARDLGHPFAGDRAAHPDDAVVAPVASGKRRAMLGYYVGNPSGASHATVVANGSKLAYISPAWYWLDHARPGLFKKDPNFGAFTDDHVREVIALSRRKGIKVLALFHNLTSDIPADRDLLHRVLTEPALRDACLNDIVTTVRAFDFDGVNMDFESVHLKDKANYAEFMRLLRERLAPLGKLTTIAVPAKFSDADNSWNGPFDYAKMGQHCDFVMVMTYDEHGSWSKPGPVASLPWVEKAMQYAVSRIPAEKVVMGFPTYGRDWTSDGKCRSISCVNAELLIKSQNLTPKWDAYFATPTLEYTDAAGLKHTIWYENRESLARKLALLAKYDLHGAGMWRLGMETPDFWTIPY